MVKMWNGILTVAVLLMVKELNSVSVEWHVSDSAEISARVLIQNAQVNGFPRQ